MAGGFSSLDDPISYFKITDTIFIQITYFGYTYLLWYKSDATLDVFRRIQKYHKDVVLSHSDSKVPLKERGWSMQTKVNIDRYIRFENEAKI